MAQLAGASELRRRIFPTFCPTNLTMLAGTGWHSSDETPDLPGFYGPCRTRRTL